MSGMEKSAVERGGGEPEDMCVGEQQQAYPILVVASGRHTLNGLYMHVAAIIRMPPASSPCVYLDLLLQPVVDSEVVFARQSSHIPRDRTRSLLFKIHLARR